VAVGTEPEVMQNAAIRLLGLDTQQIKKQTEDIIFGQLRQVIATMHIEDINRDREKFLTNIQDSVEPELRKIGLVLINVNITDITDESGYIEAIGQKAASTAIQQARGDVAEQEKLGEIRVAEAEKEKSVQVANANRSREIGIREAQRDQIVRVAELEREQGVAQQAAIFARDAQVKDEERKMRIAIAEANARAVEGENIAQAAVADTNAELTVRQAAANAKAVEGENQAHAAIAASNATLLVKRAEAYQLGETRKREAEAAVLEAQNRALARAALAEAEKIEAERRAALEAPAKAEKARTIVEAEAVAERRRLEAMGEAAATYAKLEAEARGQYEILAKKGEGLRAIIEAAGGADQAFKLLMLEHLDKLAETAAKAISNIKFDKVIVWESGGQNGTSVTANFLQNFARTLPPMLQVMKEIGGVEMPETLVKMADGIAEKAPEAAPIVSEAQA